MSIRLSNGTQRTLSTKHIYIFYIYSCIWDYIFIRSTHMRTWRLTRSQINCKPINQLKLYLDDEIFTSIWHILFIHVCMYLNSSEILCVPILFIIRWRKHVPNVTGNESSADGAINKKINSKLKGATGRKSRRCACVGQVLCVADSQSTAVALTSRPAQQAPHCPAICLLCIVHLASFFKFELKCKLCVYFLLPWL